MSLPVAVAVAIIGCVLAVSANVTTGEMRHDLDKERYIRIVKEKELQKAQRTISFLKKDVTVSQQKIAKIESILNEGEITKSDLKSKLTDVSQKNMTLQQQIMALQEKMRILQKRQESAAKKPVENP